MFITRIFFGFLFLALLPAKGIAQESLCSVFRRLPRPEKWWAFTHIFTAKKAYSVSMETLYLKKKLIGDSLLGADDPDGKLDAFKHAYWMARMTQEIKWKKALSLGDAHERSDRMEYNNKKMQEDACHDSISFTMDKWNNWIGIAIGKQYPQAHIYDIEKYVKEAVRSGIVKVVRKNNIGESLDENGNVIPKSEWFCKWNNDRCLVGSNYSH